MIADQERIGAAAKLFDEANAVFAELLQTQENYLIAVSNFELAERELEWEIARHPNQGQIQTEGMRAVRQLIPKSIGYVEVRESEMRMVERAYLAAQVKVEHVKLRAMMAKTINDLIVVASSRV